MGIGKAIRATGGSYRQATGDHPWLREDGGKRQRTAKRREPDDDARLGKREKGKDGRRDHHFTEGPGREAASSRGRTGKIGGRCIHQPAADLCLCQVTHSEAVTKQDRRVAFWNQSTLTTTPTSFIPTPSWYQDPAPFTTTGQTTPRHRPCNDPGGKITRERQATQDGARSPRLLGPLQRHAVGRAARMRVKGEEET